MGTVPLSALDALNAFLGTVQSGAVVTAVTDLYLCYELQSTTATPMALVPPGAFLRIRLIIMSTATPARSPPAE